MVCMILLTCFTGGLFGKTYPCYVNTKIIEYVRKSPDNNYTNVGGFDIVKESPDEVVKKIQVCKPW